MAKYLPLVQKQMDLRKALQEAKLADKYIAHCADPMAEFTTTEMLAVAMEAKAIYVATQDLLDWMHEKKLDQ